jgi:hypothetical protein
MNYSEKIYTHLFPSIAKTLIFHTKKHSIAIKISYLTKQNKVVSVHTVLKYGRTKILAREGNIHNKSKLRVEILNANSIEDNKPYINIVDVDEESSQYIMHIHDPTTPPFTSVYYDNRVCTLQEIAGYEL